MSHPKFQASAALPGMVPGVAVVPLYPEAGAPLNVFSTGGLTDATRWLHGKLDGASTFASLEEADAAAESAGGYLARRADHFVYIARGGLFDPGAS